MSTNRRRVIQIALVSAVIAVLAGLLVVRLTALAGPRPPAQAAAAPAAPHAGPVPPPPPSLVPAPAPIPSAGLAIPCWACPEAREWPLRFRTDLDLLAPLGTGTENAGVWFKEFERQHGARWEEAAAAEKRRVPEPKVGLVLPLHDPLLREAAPQRLLSAARVTEVDLTAHLTRTLLGKASLDLPEAKLDTLIARATAGPDRRLRVEPMVTLAIVERLGTSEQRARATATLESLSRSADAIIAGQARYLLGWTPSDKELLALIAES